MPVIRTHGNTVIPSSFLHSSSLFNKNFLYNGEHVYITFQMIGFVKITFLIALCTTQVNKMYPVCKPLENMDQIVFRNYP